MAIYIQWNKTRLYREVPGESRHQATRKREKERGVLPSLDKSCHMAGLARCAHRMREREAAMARPWVNVVWQMLWKKNSLEHTEQDGRRVILLFSFFFSFASRLSSVFAYLVFFFQPLSSCVLGEVFLPSLLSSMMPFLIASCLRFSQMIIVPRHK